MSLPGLIWEAGKGKKYGRQSKYCYLRLFVSCGLFYWDEKIIEAFFFASSVDTSAYQSVRLIKKRFFTLKKKWCQPIYTKGLNYVSDINYVTNFFFRSPWLRMSTWWSWGRGWYSVTKVSKEIVVGSRIVKYDPNC